jgi:deazaflavin-dependent oxidoreductase (nitroreductase family)
MDNFKLPNEVRDAIAAHIALYLKDPEAAHLWDASVIGVKGVVPTLLLRTIGRKSAEERYVALQYFRPEGQYAVVASKGGVPTHPAWYLNLQDNPVCEIRVGSFRSTASARTVEGDERERLWPLICGEQPEYVKYQARTSRLIPIVVLDVPST